MSVRLPIAQTNPPHGTDPLIAAIHAGDVATVRRLIEAEPRRVHVHVPLAVPGAEPAREELWLPLHHAAALGDAAIVAFLLDAGAHPDARTRATTPDHARATALHFAAAAGHASIVDLLLDADAETHVIDAAGSTPMAVAASDAVVRRLRSAGDL